MMARSNSAQQPTSAAAALAAERHNRWAERMSSIHDSLLTGYSVDGHSRTIVLHTEPHAGGGEAFIDVVFRGVVAYHFEGDCFHNIVFGVDEVPPTDLVIDRTSFEARFAQHGWPGSWDPKRETPEQFLTRPGVRVFQLGCSYGMGGWIAAQSVDKLIVQGPAQQADAAGGPQAARG
jgi:hypothetical protein